MTKTHKIVLNQLNIESSTYLSSNSNEHSLVKIVNYAMLLIAILMNNPLNSEVVRFIHRNIVFHRKHFILIEQKIILGKSFGSQTARFALKKINRYK